MNLLNVIYQTTLFIIYSTLIISPAINIYLLLKLYKDSAQRKIIVVIGVIFYLVFSCLFAISFFVDT